MAGRSFFEGAVGKKTVYRGRAINFCVDRVRLPNGRLAVREYVDHPGAVAVVPFVDRETVVLVRQFRYPIGRATFEIPAGKLDPRESALRCLRRELREETGYTAETITRLITFWPAPAFSNEALHIYVARGLSPGPAAPDEDEFIEAIKLPFARALRWVAAGKIRDAKTVVGLLACALEGGGKRPPRRGRL